MLNIARTLESIYCIVKKILYKIENDNIILQDAFGNQIEQ